MVILGVIVDARAVTLLTREFLWLKRRHFPKRFDRGPSLDHVLTEIKSGEILHMTRSTSRDRRRRLKAEATYCYAVQDIVTHVCHFLRSHASQGILVADSRSPKFDVSVAHSIFTQKWRTGDDPYEPLLEVQLFANSQNHVGLQIADMVASTLVLPMTAAAYGAPTHSVHSSAQYRLIRNEHGRAVRDLQYRYVDAAGRWRGGLVVSDPVGRRPGSLLFGDGDPMTLTVSEPPAVYAAVPA